LMVLLDSTIVIVALPSIQADLGFSEQGLQWVLSAYAITVAGLLLLGGRATDLLGRRRVFMVGIALFTAALLFSGLAWSPAALLAGRTVQGVGAAIMTPTALSIISTTFPEGSERNKALGIWGAMGGIGATAGWLIGGPLVDGPGWEWIFFINIPLGLAALALAPVLLQESRATLSQRSYDPAGALTITGALVLVYAVVKAPDVGWGDAQTIFLFAGSAALLGVFALIESRHPAPLVPLRVLRSRTLVGANLVMFLFGTAAFGMPYILTLYAQQVLGYSAFGFGAGTAVLAVAAAVSSIAAQGAVLKLGFRPVATTGMLLASLPRARAAPQVRPVPLLLLVHLRTLVEPHRGDWSARDAALRLEQDRPGVHRRIASRSVGRVVGERRTPESRRFAPTWSVLARAEVCTPRQPMLPELGADVLVAPARRAHGSADGGRQHAVQATHARPRGHAHRRTVSPWAREPSPQLTAFFTSVAIFFSSAAVRSFSAQEVGHIAPLSRFALSLKPNVAYLALNLSALWKKQRTLPSLAYAGIPYQVLGMRSGAASLIRA
jgi:MFS family permease